jgi:hypothetical protein
MTPSPGELLTQLGVPEERHAIVIAAYDEVEAARAAKTDRAEIDRLTIALGALVEDCFGF